MSRTPVHPGEILAEELEARELTAAELARAIQVPPNRVTQIINGKRNITGDTALRLGKYFGTGAEFWMNLQMQFDLQTASREIGKVLDRIPTQAA